MIDIIQTPIMDIDPYNACQVLGVVLSVTIQMILLYVSYKKISYILFSVIFGFCMAAGGFASSLVRQLDYGGMKSIKDMLSGAAGAEGDHFLGRVIVCAFLYIPLVILLYKLLRRSPINIKDLSRITNILGIVLFIQHMFGRLGCFLNGCCYGQPYNGIFSVEFPYGEVNYPVFPSQMLEVILAFAAVLVFAFLLKKRGMDKSFFGSMVSAFAIIIFISEFTMDKRGTVMYYGLSVIQYIAIMTFVLGAAIQYVMRRGKVVRE